MGESSWRIPPPKNISAKNGVGFRFEVNFLVEATWKEKRLVWLVVICELVYVQVAMVDYTSLRSHQIYSTINLITNTAVVGTEIFI